MDYFLLENSTIVRYTLEIIDEPIEWCAPTSTGRKQSLANYAVATVIVLTIILIGILLIRPSITAAQGGKIIAFLAFFLLPIVATVLGASIHLENSTSTQFCLSCHVMESHGNSLYIDDPTYVPAAHFQNNRIPKEQACFTCHTDYTMFGDLNAKLRGVKHLYVHYFKAPPKKLALYEPFKNRECLHCHANARSYEESTPHKEMKEQLSSNDMSCLTCHSKIHDVANIDKTKKWKGPGV
jgi:cytochrome c-type protein NapC